MVEIITVTPEGLRRIVREAVRAELAPITSAIAPLLEDAGWLTLEKAAEAHGVTVSTINRWIASGQMQAKGAGRARRVKKF